MPFSVRTISFECVVKISQGFSNLYHMSLVKLHSILYCVVELTRLEYFASFANVYIKFLSLFLCLLVHLFVLHLICKLSWNLCSYLNRYAGLRFAIQWIHTFCLYLYLVHNLVHTFDPNGPNIMKLMSFILTRAFPPYIRTILLIHSLSFWSIHLDPYIRSILLAHTFSRYAPSI